MAKTSAPDPAHSVRSEPFSQIWSDGFRRVLVLRVIGAGSHVGLRLGASLKTAFLTLVVGSLPALVNFLLLVLAPMLATRTGKDLVWLWAFAGVNAIVLSAGLIVWTYVARGSADVDRMVASPHARQHMKIWLERKLAYRAQLVLPVLGAVAAVAYLWISAPFVRQEVNITLISFVSVGWTSFLAGNSLYWLFTAPGLVREVRRASLHLKWHDPASTPGLVVLARGTGITSVTLVVGSAGVAVAGFVAPSTAQLLPVQVLLVALFVALLGGVVVSGISPLLEIHRIIVESKIRSLEALSSIVPDLRAGLKNKPAGLRSLQLYELVSKVPEWPFPTSALVQYAAALIATIVAFILSVIHAAP